MKRRMKASFVRGYVLATVLWLLAGLSLMAALMNDSALSVAYRVHQLRTRVNFLQTAYSAQAQALVWLASARPQSIDYYNGRDSVLVNNTPYRILGEQTLSLQDHAGLLQLNMLDRKKMAGFLVLCGVDKNKTALLMDALEDYIDEDDLMRVNGAEKDIYAQAGLASPRNAPLLSEQEIWQVYGWGKEKKLIQDKACDRMWSVTGTAGFFGADSHNISTAPNLVLLASGVDEQTVKDMQNMRRQPAEALARAAMINQQLGMTGVFGMASSGQAGRFIKITHSQENGQLRLGYTIELQATNSVRPWNVIRPVLWAEPVQNELISPTGVTSVSTLASTQTHSALAPLAWPQGFADTAQRNNVQDKLPF